MRVLKTVEFFVGFQKKSLPNSSICSFTGFVQNQCCNNSGHPEVSGSCDNCSEQKKKKKKPRSLNFNVVCGISCDSLRDELVVLEGQLLAI